MDDHPLPRPFVCAANCSKSHGRIDLVFGQRAIWAEPVPTVAPLACGHPVCLECVSARPEVLTQCAQCGFSAATRASPAAVRSKHKPPRSTAQQQVPWAPGRNEEKSEEEIAGVHPTIDVNEIACQVCGSGDDDAMMVLCDDCPRGFHTYCLTPPLQQIPSGDWFCPRCSQQREENKKRARDRAAEHWCNKRKATATAASAAPSSAAALVGATGETAELHAAEGSSDTAPTHAQRSPGTVDALRSGFVEYCRQIQPSIERAEPHLSRSAVLAKLAGEWRVLSDANRRKYAALAAQAKRQQRLSAVAAEMNGAMGGSMIVSGAESAAMSTFSSGDTASIARPHGPVIPLFVRATRQVMEGSEYWLALTPTGEGRLEVKWRIPDAATCVIVALGWAQGRPAYVERTDTSSVLQRAGVIHFTGAHIARFAGCSIDKSGHRGTGTGDQEGGFNGAVKEARPLVMRMWRDATFGDHGALYFCTQSCAACTDAYVMGVACVHSRDHRTVRAAVCGRWQRRCFD